MNTKLTLSLNEKVILAAKKYAKSHKTSISKMVEDYFLHLTDSKEKEYSDIVEEMIGIVSIDDSNPDHDDVKLKYLTDKYLRD